LTKQSGQLPTNHTGFPPSIIIGNFKVMYRPGLAFEEAKTRLAQQGFQLQETAHFLLARAPANQAVTIVHHFTPQEIDNNLVDFLMQELDNLMTSDQAFGQALRGVVHSVIPYDSVKAWNLFSMNTLQRLRQWLIDAPTQDDRQSTIGASAIVYRRLLSLKVGSSLLDVGCACAFWPVLVAEREPMPHGRIIGVDNRRDAINLSTNLATQVGMNDLEFVQIDVLTPGFVELGTFDTVTTIHMLEHLAEAQLPQAFEHLLKVTGHRLIIAVPYEQQATSAYGHEQVFTQEKLKQWGQWCVESIGGSSRYWCEDVAGGLLIIDRSPEA
jgi:2-polyprenyl-3-methyl-5-hydroxy-6-metoxy-1,4-benzoquinol methylase